MNTKDLSYISLMEHIHLVCHACFAFHVSLAYMAMGRTIAMQRHNLVVLLSALADYTSWNLWNTEAAFAMHEVRSLFAPPSLDKMTPRFWKWSISLGSWLLLRIATSSSLLIFNSLVFWVLIISLTFSPPSCRLSVICFMALVLAAHNTISSAKSRFLRQQSHHWILKSVGFMASCIK